MNTLDYYNENATAYYSNTVDADVSALYAHFEPLLPKQASIIDVGCGSGRDSKHFLDAGFAVTPIDGSKELCKLAESYLGISVRCMLFNELDYCSEFDAAWACSSLLHVPKKDLPNIVRLIDRALKPGGAFYASFKYGENERVVSGRSFSDFTEKNMVTLTESAPDLSLHSYWISSDVRSDRGNEKWLNIIWLKRETLQGD